MPRKRIDVSPNPDEAPQIGSEGRRANGEGGKAHPWYRDGEQVGWRSSIRVDGKRVNVYGKTKQEVAQKLRQAQANARAGVQDPKRKTLTEYLDNEWLPHMRGPVSLRTWVGYEGHCRLHIIPRIGHIKLAKLVPADVQRMIDELASSPDVKPRTVLHIWRTLHNALEHAVRPLRYLAENPASKKMAGIVLPRVEEPDMAYLNLDEAKKLVALFPSHRLGPLWLTALMTGMREGELFGVRWRDVDLDQGWLTVAQTVWWHREPGEEHQTPRFKSRPKNQKARRVPLSPAVVQMLREWRRTQARERDQAGSSYAPYHLVFTQPDGQPLRHTQVLWQLRKLIEQAGVTRIGMHSLRHSAASIHIYLGANIKEVAELLGHSTTAITTKFYTHLFEDATKVAANRMDNALFGEKEPAAPVDISSRQKRSQ